MFALWKKAALEKNCCLPSVTKSIPMRWVLKKADCRCCTSCQSIKYLIALMPIVDVVAAFFHPDAEEETIICVS
jgi:hypothetical protein